MTPCTIHVVDDDASVREALTLLLKLEGFRVRCYASGQAFVKRTPSGCGCIVLDMRLGDMTGQDVLEVLARRGNAMPVIILTAYGDIPTTVKAIRAGAVDYLTKSDNPALQVTRIRQLVAESVAKENTKKGKPNAFAAKLKSLTPREREVFDMARSGLDSQAIADQLSLSLRTIEAHRSKIASKFKVSSLAEVFREVAKESKGQ